MMKHLGLSLDLQHFRRWLELFAETARETMLPEHAALVISKSERIATKIYGRNRLRARSPRLSELEKSSAFVGLYRAAGVMVSMK